MVAGTAAAPLLPAAPAKRSATDWVKLGKTGVDVTRLAFGTGTMGGRVQRELGQAEFTRLVRHAYDRGVRFFESADAYDQMHEMLAEALKGLPRESYRLMTKFRFRERDKPFETIDRFRREMNTDYFDILLIHVVRSPNWATELEPLRDAFSEAKHRQIIRSHGASCHGLQPLRAYPSTPWLDVALNRINHSGMRMDNPQGDDKAMGDVDEVTSLLRQTRQQGTGMLGMKIIGEGAFNDPEQRDKSFRFVMKSGLVDAVTIGFKSPAEIDEAIERMNKHLNS